MEHRDYSRYRFTLKDWFEFLVRAILKGMLLCYLFYDSIMGIFILFPFLILDYKFLYSNKLSKQKEELTNEFQSMMESLVTSLNAGYSLEYAFRDAKKDLLLVYETNAVIFKEMDIIIEGLKMNVPLETLLLDFSKRSHIEDIENFANVVAVAKKSGGNLIRILEKTVKNITDKIMVEQEIETMIAAKKLEEQIMMLMPYGIILYLRLCNGDFLDVLYHNVPGVILMTIFLVLVYVADMWAKKIMEIRV